MAENIDAKLAEMGLELPETPAPQANYVPYVISGKTVYVSGQISQDHNGLIKGKLGADMDAAVGAAAAKTCALSLLAQVKAACDGDLSRLARVVKLTGFVNSTLEFTQQPQVINGASDLLVELHDHKNPIVAQAAKLKATAPTDGGDPVTVDLTLSNAEARSRNIRAWSCPIASELSSWLR